jgi:tRNA(His) 5'-end guanylyltransferase
MSNDKSLGDRMKEDYENRFRTYLPRRSYTIIRVDGKSFKNYTRGLKKPFDEGLIQDMNETTAYLCKNIMGARLGYCQSDEITIVITDFGDESTQSWFDNNLQKMCSVAASMATNKFNELRNKRYLRYELFFNHNSGSDDSPKVILENYDILDEYWPKQAEFDARVFQIPQKVEVINCLIFRQQDAVRNSISSVAQSMFSAKELHGVKTDQMQEMIFQKTGINWNDYSFREKRGGVIAKVSHQVEGSTRNKWEMIETPIFTQDKEFLNDLIPNNN